MYKWHSTEILLKDKEIVEILPADNSDEEDDLRR